MRSPHPYQSGGCRCGTRPAATLASPTLAPASQAAASSKPGLVGGRVVLANNASFSGYDVGTDGAGNTYIGWIGDRANDPSANRRVYLCTLPPGASACKHGIQSIASLGISEAADLRLLVSKGGLVTLLWYTLGLAAGVQRPGRTHRRGDVPVRRPTQPGRPRRHGS